jgi:hypothetical protein
LAFHQTNLFSYFASLKKTNQLPAFEDLEATARKLYRAYTSSQAQYRALYDTDRQSEWSKIVPLGTPWTGPIAEESSIDVGITAKNSRAPKLLKPIPAQESSAGLGTLEKPSKKGQK